jgi:hypothetical protein
MGAHYSGICKNLSLQANFEALQIAAIRRQAKKMRDNYRLFDEQELDKIGKEADAELDRRGDWNISTARDGYFSIEIELGIIQVHVAKHALALMRIIRSEASSEEIAKGIDQQRGEILKWYSTMSEEHKEAGDIAIDRSGFLVKTREIRVPNVA